MILTILKSPLRSRQLLVIWLIFGVGLLPDKTEGLKCHSCKGDACKTDAGAECTSGFCEKITEGGTVEMKCSDAAKEAECIKKTFPNGCYTVNDDNKEKLTPCMGTDPLGENAQKSGVTICSCNTDLCNKAEGAAGSKGSGSVNEKHGGGGVSGGGSSTNANTTSEGADGRDSYRQNRIKCYYCIGESECGKSVSDMVQKDCLGSCSQIRRDGKVYQKGCGQATDNGIKCMDKVNGCLSSDADVDKVTNCLLSMERSSVLIPRGTCVCGGNLCNVGERSISQFNLVYAFASTISVYQLLI